MLVHLKKMSLSNDSYEMDVEVKEGSTVRELYEQVETSRGNKIIFYQFYSVNNRRVDDNHILNDKDSLLVVEHLGGG